MLEGRTCLRLGAKKLSSGMSAPFKSGLESDGLTSGTERTLSARERVLDAAGAPAFPRKQIPGSVKTRRVRLAVTRWQQLRVVPMIIRPAPVSRLNRFDP